MEPLSRAVLEGARSGDRDAFALIIRTYFRTAFAVALAIVTNPVDAEDVVQDAFVRCWQRLDQIRSPSSFPGWLRSIVRSVAMNHIERESVRATEELDATSTAGGESPVRDLERRELRDQLTSAMTQLTASQREVLLLYDLEGFRHREIADLLGISELVSRRHLSNARKRMRRAMAQPETRSASK